MQIPALTPVQISVHSCCHTHCKKISSAFKQLQTTRPTDFLTIKENCQFVQVLYLESIDEVVCAAA